MEKEITAYEFLQKDGSLILVKSNLDMEQLTNLLNNIIGEEVVSHTIADQEELDEDKDYDYIFIDNT